MISMSGYFGDVSVVRLLVQRGMAAIYLIAFIAVLHQFKPLLGERGLLPVPETLERLRFKDSPGLFVWRYSDRLLDAVGWTGLVISAAALLGLTERGPIWLSMAAWLVLWFLYLSIVNAGNRFFGFGWESMLLEAGFFTAFLGPRWVEPSILPLLILRWMLFRTEMGAGLIKLRHDSCWRDLTCLYYHYETQPLPNLLSWYFHRIPAPLHRFSALVSHFVQVVVPFALFAPQPFAAIAGALIIFHQLVLIISGNYSWLNWLTVVLGLAAFSDRTLFLSRVLNRVPHPSSAWVGSGVGSTPLASGPLWFHSLLWIVTAATVLMSVRPTQNLFSRHQAMNRSYNRWHLVNAYGAFGRVGRERYEIILEGTADRVITAATRWQEYEFIAKPGDVKRRPPQIAPYHLRLDWLVWFIPFSVQITPNGIRTSGYDMWFVRLAVKLLSGDAAILRLMGANPFPDHPPTHLRALIYLYNYTTPQEKRETGAWWTRKLLGVYLPPLSLEDVKQ